MAIRQKDGSEASGPSSKAAASPAFLLAQVGGHAAMKFGGRLSVLEQARNREFIGVSTACDRQNPPESAPKG